MKVHQSDDAVLVELVGRLIYDNLAIMAEELDKLMNSKAMHVFLKMDELNYLDSSALGMLLNLNNTARQQGKKLTMVAPPAHIRDIFASTRLDNIFDIVGAEDAGAIHEKFRG